MSEWLSNKLSADVYAALNSKDLNDTTESNTSFDIDSNPAVRREVTPGGSFHTFHSSQPKAIQFAFVNSTGPGTTDRDAKKLVRQYATQSGRHQKQNQHTFQRRVAPNIRETSKTKDGGVSAFSSSKAFPMVPSICRLGASRSDPFIKYPFEPTQRDRRLLSHIFDASRVGIIPYREVFFPVALTDPAAFHQVLANMALQLRHHNPSGFKSEGYESSEVVIHHAKAIEIVQKRLANPEAATKDGNIGAIIAMACHSHLTQDFAAWHYHMNGLIQIFKMQQDLRRRNGVGGGDPKFISNSIIRHSLGWVDAAGCETQDISPRFPFLGDFVGVFPDFSSDLTPEEIIPQDLAPSPLALALSCNLRATFPAYSEAFDLFDVLGRFTARLSTQLINSNRSVYQDLNWSCRHLHPLSHRLLSYRSRVEMDSLGSIIQEATRLSMLLFVAQIRRNFGITPLIMDIYIDKLRLLLQIHKDWAEFSLFRLWVVVMGAMEATGASREGFVLFLKDVLQVLEIRSHAAAEDRLRDLIWIGEVHGLKFWALYKEVWIEGG